MSQKKQSNLFSSLPNSAYVTTVVNSKSQGIRNAREEVKSSQIARKLFAEVTKLEIGDEDGIVKLNKALRFAISDEDFALIYELRWRIASKMFSFHSAIRNIELALLHNHPNTKEFQKSKALCQEQLELECMNFCTSPDSDPFDRTTLKLSREAHPKIPWIINCLALKEDTENGKHIITTEDLKVGDIIAIDKPFHASVLEGDSGIRCTNCLKYSPLTLIPCTGCTSVMFCSEECLEAAKFHQYECKMLSKVFNSPDNSRCWIELRSLLTAITAFDGKIGEMCEFFEANEGKTIFNFDFSDSTHPDYMKNFALAAYHQEINDQRFPSIDKQRSMAMYNKALLTNVPCCNNALKKCDKCRSFMLKFLAKSSLQSSVFAELGSMKLSRKWGGSFPLKSMFPHSCAPNLKQIPNASGLNAYVVMFPIKANEPLTLGQWIDFTETSLIRRRASFKERFSVVCSCPACKFNYPTLSNLISIDKETLQEVEDDLNRVEMDSEWRLALVDEYGDYLNDNMHKYPTKEMVLMQKFVGKCYLKFSNSMNLSRMKESLFGKNHCHCGEDGYE